jgi:Na+-transporting NADH:ubiquinone oxidoreductase subunit NqrF
MEKKNRCFIEVERECVVRVGYEVNISENDYELIKSGKLEERDVVEKYRDDWYGYDIGNYIELMDDEVVEVYGVDKIPYKDRLERF